MLMPAKFRLAPALLMSCQSLNQLTTNNQINMKKMLKLASVAVVALVLAQSLQAALITGNIGFSGGAVLNNTSANNATAVTSWINPVVQGQSGSFNPVLNLSPVTFTAGIWNFTTGATIAPFWSVGGFTFNLLSSYVVAQGGTAGLNAYVVVAGTGLVSGNGYTPTQLSWTFTSQDPSSDTIPATWTFSASAASVPDGGATVLLLGIALSGVALLRRKLTA